MSVVISVIKNDAILWVAPTLSLYLCCPLLLIHLAFLPPFLSFLTPSLSILLSWPFIKMGKECYFIKEVSQDMTPVHHS
jgi:hypothetical protein